MTIHQASPIRFIAAAAALLLFWVVLYDGFLLPYGQPDAFLTKLTARGGQALLSLLHYPTASVPTETGIILIFHGEEVLEIARNCNGLAIFALFAGFILLFPGAMQQKLWYIPAGIVILFFINVLRVTLLTITQIHHPEWLYFNHKYTFTILVYAVVFLLWISWVKLQKLKLKRSIEEKLQHS